MQVKLILDNYQSLEEDEEEEEECYGEDSNSVLTPGMSTAGRRFRLDSSAEPQSSPSLPIGSLQPDITLQSDLANLSASTIMENINAVAGIVGATSLSIPNSLFNLHSSFAESSPSTSSASVLTADGEVQQLISSLPNVFSSSSSGDTPCLSSLEDYNSSIIYHASQLLSSTTSSSSSSSSNVVPTQELFSSEGVANMADSDLSSIS